MSKRMIMRVDWPEKEGGSVFITGPLQPGTTAADVVLAQMKADFPVAWAVEVEVDDD